MRATEVGTDGNCLFRSFAHVLFCDEKRHAELRRMAVQFLRLNPTILQNVAVHTPDPEDDDAFADPETYLHNMSKDGFWAGNYELNALAQALSRPVFVHNSSTNILTKLFEDFGGKPIYIRYNGTNHYTPIDLTTGKDQSLSNSRQSSPSLSRHGSSEAQDKNHERWQQQGPHGSRKSRSKKEREIEIENLNEVSQRSKPSQKNMHPQPTTITNKPPKLRNNPTTAQPTHPKCRMKLRESRSQVDKYSPTHANSQQQLGTTTHKLQRTSTPDERSTSTISTNSTDTNSSTSTNTSTPDSHSTNTSNDTKYTTTAADQQRSRQVLLALTRGRHNTPHDTASSFRPPTLESDQSQILSATTTSEEYEAFVVVASLFQSGPKPDWIFNGPHDLHDAVVRIMCKKSEKKADVHYTIEGFQSMPFLVSYTWAQKHIRRHVSRHLWKKDVSTGLHYVDLTNKNPDAQEALLRDLRRSPFHFGPNFVPSRRNRSQSSLTNSTNSQGSKPRSAVPTILRLQLPTAEFQTNSMEAHWNYIHNVSELELGKYPVDTMCHVPYKQRKRCGSILREVYNAATTVKAHNEAASTAVFKLVTFFPLMILYNPGFGTETTLTDRMNMFCNLQWEGLLSNALADVKLAATAPRPSRPYKGRKQADHADSLNARAISLCEAGELSRAYQRFTTQTPPVQPTPETVEALKEKHPAPDRPTLLPIPNLLCHDITTPELTSEAVRRAISTSPKESAPGPCGLRFEFFREMTRGPDDSLLQILTTFMNQLITGKGAPEWYYLF